MKNNVKKCRLEKMWSIPELADKSGLNYVTIVRVEKGRPCHPKTKRKILEALGFSIEDRFKVFPELERE